MPINPLLCAILVLTAQFGVNNVKAQERLEVPALVDVRTENSAGPGKVSSGRFRVYENRTEASGKVIHLDFVVLHATNQNPEPDPFFVIAGGPGQAIVNAARGWNDHWIRESRDVVFINQRGTSGDNLLAFEMKTEGDTLQQYLESLWEPELVRTNLERLQQDFDLTQYSTCNAADDLNDFRLAMGYDKINISGASYGTRASLVYIRRHGGSVRTAILHGCAPIEFRNPLYHAPGAQRALDLIFDEVEANEPYRNAFGDLRSKFETILDRLEVEPAEAEVIHSGTGKTETVTLTRGTFASAVRFQMYYSGNSRRLPLLINAAYDGDYRPFATSALQQNIGLRQSIAMGMLLCVTSAEDVARITPDEIESVTAGSFVGSSRVHSQMAAAGIWPRSELPENYGEPVCSDVQTLIFSGTIDPVTPPQWGDLVHGNFPNSLHVVVPAAHDIGGPCVDLIKRQFLTAGTVENLNTSCVDGMQLAPLELPPGT
ncbi:MAG: alpha/beta fold hydrolase [Planctomycetota bacterium]